MKKHTKLWLVLFMLLSMALSFGGIASGQTNPFPPTKEPSSARFDISGLYSTFLQGGDVGGQSFTRIIGTGAVSGKNMQLDMTMHMEAPETAGEPPDPSDPDVVRISMVLLDGKLYFKLPNFTGEERWVVTDAAGLTAGSLTGSMTGMAGLDPRYASAFTVTQEDKETLNGAPTTRYRIDVDYEKLLSAMGSAPGTSLPRGATSDTQYVMHIWIGDNDMYLHKMHISLDSITTIADATLTTGLGLTITFRDFDRPVMITAPPNAEELDLSSLGLDPSMLPGGGVLGMPGAVASGVGMGMPRIGTGMVGMPRSGAPSGNFPFEVMAVVSMGLLCLVLGGLARRTDVRG